MKITGRARKLAIAVAVPGVALGAFAGFGFAPAMASTGHPAAQHAVFREETITGAARSNNGYVPVAASGAFRDYGYANLNGRAVGITSINLGHGTFRVYHHAGKSQAYLNKKSCYVVDTVTTKYWVVGGTGRYDHAKGWGTAYARFSATMPKKSGKCDTSSRTHPVRGTTHSTFLLKGPAALGR
jgi:hypothetical protein